MRVLLLILVATAGALAQTPAAVRVAHGSLWVAAGSRLTWRLDPLLVTAIRP